MILGLKTKNKNRVSDQDHYIVCVKEISPWAPLQASPLPQSILLQWDNGNKNSGSLVSCNRNGKIEFGESFRLPVTLSPESSRRSGHRDRFPKNCLEFYLYEPRRDKNAKGHLLGSAVVNLADYGIIRETISISTPINLKKSSKIRIAGQPMLYFNIRPFDKGSSSSSPGGSSLNELSFDKDGSSSFSESINVETESTPLTDDDDISSQSSRTVSSSVFDSQRESYNQHDNIGSEPVDGGITRSGPPLHSDGTSANQWMSSNSENLVTHPTDKVSSSEACVSIPVDMNSDHVKDKDSQRKIEGAGKAWRHDQSCVDRNSSSDSRVGHWKGNAERSSWKDELDSQVLGPEEYSLQDRLGLRQKNLKPVQLHVDEAKSNGPSKVQFMEKAEDNSIPEKTSNGTTSDILGEKEETNSKADSDNGYGLLKKTQVKDKTNENDVSEEMHSSPTSNTCNEITENAKSFSKSNVELDSKIEMLEEELIEAAVLEASLYSVVAEHGGSTNKVHAPARRLSRFYLHACSANTQDKRASAARAAISGLVLVSKACGHDVPRLTFWLSNSIVLRATVSHTIGEMQLCSESSDDWVDPQTFLHALQKFEAWIFSRIIESVWWQTLTPYMQSAAAKCPRSRKTSSRKHGLGDQEQEKFSFELWKKAFKDTCNGAIGGQIRCAMFNAILRESDDEMPTDPISDPISDSKVLPIPSGRSSFGAGVLLKNSIGNWSRWLSDLFGIDDSESHEDSTENEVGESKNAVCEGSFKAFSLLNALSDLMMLPSDMLVDSSTRKEVCPKFSVPLITRVLNNFVPDEFNPNPVSQAVFEALEEDLSEAGEESITNFPRMASPIAYSPPSATSLTDIIGNQAMERSQSSALRKSYTSDDELDELDSPITAIMIENPQGSPTSKEPNWMKMGKGGRKVVRYQLIREIWKDGE
ncbi:Thioredoxin O2, putative isoform 1 [Hibiscus syriacus]|uniref:Thioredoxin O2, putative isoform 1 n=1 Tax=Hibiscus syriacus TaxID=106335 RepID=A0A6A2ZIP9_HIBSY|nr:Thioredoxin O2, putative isoform 1 [Hibiscus syriacus]